MKKLALVLALILCLGAFAACGGGNKEKVTAIQTKFASLVEKANELVAVVQELVNSGLDVNQEYIDYANTSSDYINSFGQASLDGKSDKELDEISAQIDAMITGVTTTLDNINAQLSE